MFQCPDCSGTFRFNKNLYKHMRQKHKKEPSILGKISCPLQCAERFRTYQVLRSHLETSHGQVMEKEELDFPDMDAFESWKKRFELTSGYAYSRRISEKTLKKGEAKTHYICHRSGVFRSESSGLRKLKKSGTNKIGKVCPSVMEVSKDLSDGKVHVTYWKTHIGHEADILRAPVQRKPHCKVSGNITFDVCVVIPAAGIGERMGLDTPKQFIPIYGKPVICYTVEAFLRMPFIKKVVVVASPENLDLMLETLTKKCSLQDEKLMVTEGCGSRHQSIDAGLRALQNFCDSPPEVAVIHDGVRPMVPVETVGNVVLAAKEHGAAGVVCPLVSTVISVDENGFLDSCLDRSKYRASEMPQAFQFDVICKAYNDCDRHDLENGTECLHLVQKYCGKRAKLLPGTTNLWKITHRKDIYLAAGCIKENQSVGIINSHLVQDLVPSLRTSLSKKFSSVHLIGKWNDSTAKKHPNLVHLWIGKSICDIIEHQAVLYNVTKQSEVFSVVHIILDSFDETLNFFEVQREAWKCAKESKVIFYFVLVQKCDSSEVFEEIADRTSSALFYSNMHCGDIIFIGS